MKLSFKTVSAVFLSGVWINASEFFRNEILLKTHWVAHYKSLGLTFPSEPVNGMMWVLWGFLFATGVYSISRKFNLLQTTLLSWFVGFVLMWVVTWNLNVLPVSILTAAIPLSLLESFLASYICTKVAPVA